MTKTETIEYTEEHRLLCELIGIAQWVDLNIEEAHPPSHPEGHPMFGDDGGVTIEIPRHLLESDPTREKEETLLRSGMLMDLLDVLDGTPWRGQESGMLTSGIVEFASQDELEAAVVKAREWLSRYWEKGNQ